MPSSTKNVLINIQANTSQIVSGLTSLSAKIDTLNTLFASMNKTSATTLSGMATSAGSASTAMGSLATSVSNTATAMGPLAASANAVLASMSPAKLSAASAAWSEVTAAFNKVRPQDGGFLGEMKKVLDPGKIATAIGYRAAYGIADLPIKAFEGVKEKIKTEIDSASQFEGTLYDLQAYMGGATGELFAAYAKGLGRTGTTEQLTASALNDIQNKILDVGQATTFTSNEIANALSEAAKAGVSIQELGKPGQQGALDAIALLAQNTGEDLTKSAIITAKLQEAFRSNLDKSQIQFGKTTDEASQYLMVVNALAQADTTSAASASQLTEALFNVGGSANNINMSFFDTLSLVGAMVPAFESAASAGTSLKYVFSRITGANSVKARESMMQMNLMDSSGQSVFFDQKGFKGMEFMVRKLRDTFGDQAGMAVDVRNRIITEIFGQDAQKAISRMVSMTEDQAQDMYKAASSMTQNASIQGDPGAVNFAQQTANIKNEGLEFDLEFLRGSLDSISKTLAVPLLKPMSAVTQSISGFANGMFAVLKGGENETQGIKNALDMIDTKMLPNSMALFTKALDYARTLKIGLDAISKEGFNTNSIATALAALLGTEKKFMAVRVEEYKVLLTQVYNGISDFIKKLPEYLDQLKTFVTYFSAAIVKGFGWLVAHWDEVVTGVKIIAAVMVADWAITSANNWITLGDAVAKYITQMGGLRAAATALPAVTQNTGLPALVVNGTSSLLGGIAKGNNWASVGNIISAAMTNLKLNFISALGAMGAAWTGFTSLFTWAGLSAGISSLGAAFASAISIILSPLAIAAALIAGFAAAWYFNVGGIQEWMMTEFGSTIEYVQQTFSMIYDAIIGAWTSISAWLQTKGGTDFLMIFSNILKVLTVIIQGLVLVIGGVLKTVVGILTLNGNLIGSGLVDIFSGVINVFKGLLAGFMGYVHSSLAGAIGAINQFSRFIGKGDVIDQKAFDNFFQSFIDKQTTGGMEAGLQYGKGLASGLRNSKTGVKDATLELTGTIKETTAKDLVISSPSEDAIKDGEFYGMGLAEGLYNSIPVVQEAALAVANALKNTVKSNITKGETEIVFNATNGIKIPKTVTPGMPSYLTDKNVGSTPLSKIDSTFAVKKSKEEDQKKTNLANASAQAAKDAKDFYAKYQGFYMDVAKNYVAEQTKKELAAGQTGGFISSITKMVDLNALKARLNEESPGSGDQQFPGGFRFKYDVQKTEMGTDYVTNQQGQKVFLRLGETITKMTENVKNEALVITRIVEKLDKTDKLRVEGSRGAKSDVEGYIKSGNGKPIIEKTTYGFAQVGGAGGFVKEFGDSIIGATQSVITSIAPVMRQMTESELLKRGNPDYAPVSQLPLDSMRGNFANLPLDQFSTDTYDVSKNVKQFQFSTEQRAIDQRGLTGVFQNKDVASQYQNIGNRAATYLSMHQGQLKPNEVTVFQQLLAQDRNDRLAYLDALKQSKEEDEAIESNGLLDSSEKQKRKKDLWSNFFQNQTAGTQSFKDVYNIKTQSLQDYTAQMGGIADQYAKLGPQAFNEALSVALNPANQSDAFKSLSPEAQAKLIEQAKKIPSQAMTFLTDAMSDGELTSTEFDTYMGYVGEDIKTMRGVLLRGSAPTQAELDAVFNPFIDGLATKVKTSDITGILGTQFGGAMGVLFKGMGQKAYNDFLGGWMTDDKGKRVKVSSLNISEILGFTPENITKYGIPLGTNISAGIIAGIKKSIVTNQPLMNEIMSKDIPDSMNAPGGLNSHSPSILIRDKVGLNAGLGLAEGFKLPLVKTTLGLNISSLFNPLSEEAHMIAIMTAVRLLGSTMGGALINQFGLTLGGKQQLVKGETAVSIGQVIVNSLMKVLTDKPYEAEAKGLGYSIALGVAEGISNGKWAVGDAIKQLIRDALEQGRNEAQSNSPSHLFADKLGSTISEGVAFGVSENGGLIGDALSPLINDAANYRPDISGIALNGAMRRSQMFGGVSSTENNYNLNLTSSYPAQTVQQQFEIMRAFKGK